MKKFLLSMVFLLMTALFANATESREVASVAKVPLSEVSATPDAPKQEVICETIIIIEYSDGTIEIIYIREKIIID